MCWIIVRQRYYKTDISKSCPPVCVHVCVCVCVSVLWNIIFIMWQKITDRDSYRVTVAKSAESQWSKSRKLSLSLLVLTSHIFYCTWILDLAEFFLCIEKKEHSHNFQVTEVIKLKIPASFPTEISKWNIDFICRTTTRVSRCITVYN